MFRAFVAIILVAVLAAGLWLAWALYLPVQPRGTQFVLLRPGWSSRHIATELQSAGVVRSARAFLLMHYALGRTLKAGEYKFDQPATARQVHDRLARGDIYVHYVTIPEGYNLYDIANAVQQAGLGSAQDFIKAAAGDVVFIRDLDPKAATLEGYLFPDTYGFTRTQSMHDMIATMVHRFRREAEQLGLICPVNPDPSAQTSASSSGCPDLHAVVTMASIVEKETAVPEERPMVASVYYNRLRRGIALAADPTVIYAALVSGHYSGAIHQSDLQFNSPYNTYRNAGMPPGPIANPGRASLEAALHPASTEFLYFVSDGNGHHRFARTLDEHSRNVAAYRRAVAASR
ncbi:MAG: endolytic transglycosylase MltG [Terriglobales bacterium]